MYAIRIQTGLWRDKFGRHKNKKQKFNVQLNLPICGSNFKYLWFLKKIC